MKLPPRKKPGDPILASDWNLMLEAIAARTPAPGQGLNLSAASGGFSYSLPGQLGQLPKGQPPFSVIAIEKSESSYYLVTMQQGWVIERNPPTASHPAVILHMPQYGGTTLDTIPRPQLHVGVNDIAWCRYKCNPAGLINYTPEIVVVAADQPGAHYYPTDPEGSGGDGDYYVKLFKLVMDGDFPAIYVYQQSDIEHWAQLWTGENVGYGVEIYKEHEESVNIYKFRRVDGRASYISDMPDAYTTEQIHLVKDNETARVIGNGRTGSRTWRDCDNNDVFKIEWNDGLITSTGHLYMLCGCDGHSNNSSNNA